MKTNEIEEAVKIVAGFMGLTVYPKESEFIPACMTHVRIDFLQYHKSLDVLVPVWKKLGLSRFSPRFSRGIDNKYYCEIMYSLEDCLDWEGSFCALAETIQQAALLATAKCIEALRNERTENTRELE